MINRIWMGILFALLTAAGAVFAGEKSLPAHSGDLMNVELNTGGSIQITGSAASKEAKIVWQVNGCEEKDIRISAESLGGSIRVSSEYTDKRRQGNCSVNINVSIPNRMDLQTHTRGGNVNVSGIEGKISGETMGGNLRFKDIKGALKMATKGGNILLEDSNADGKVSTMGGNVMVKNVAGTIDASTMGGNIYLDNVVQREGYSINSAVLVSTMGGNIQVANAPLGAKVETKGGNIIVEKASKFVEAETMGGNILIKQHDGRIKADTKGGNVTVVMVAGGSDQNIDIRSNAGKIDLTLPAEFSGAFDLEVKCFRLGSEDCKIQSDFPIQKRESADRKTIYGSGTTGSGANKVSIRTTVGDIVIRKK
jgi:hypothetical protein